MINDIYSARINMQFPSGAGGFTFWYRETVQWDQADFGTQALAEAWNLSVLPSLRAIVADDFSIPSIVVRKHWSNPEPKYIEQPLAGVGLRPGPALPANNAVVISIAQGTFPSKSNGRVYVPGVPEPDTTLGTIDAGYAALVQTLLTVLIAGIDEESPGNGHWELGVLSRLILEEGEGPPDWVNSFGAAQSLSASPIIKTQRRRTTKVIGANNG